MGHIGAYTPYLWGRYPPPVVPPCLFLKYGPTIGRENFPIKITILKIDFYFFTKLYIKNQLSKKFFQKKLHIRKMTSESRDCEKIFPEILAFSEMVSIT
jgi:hypothetical protein